MKKHIFYEISSKLSITLSTSSSNGKQNFNAIKQFFHQQEKKSIFQSPTPSLASLILGFLFELTSLYFEIDLMVLYLIVHFLPEKKI